VGILKGEKRDSLP